MAQYIDKSALVEEIEKLKDEAKIYPSDFYCGRLSICKELINFINTLAVKEVDLKEKAIQLSQKYFPDKENIWARPNIEAHKCKSACIEMVEWLKAQKGE